MSQITTYAIRKSYVRFQCPKCGEWLNTNLADAGDQDTCPCCATAFIAPGVKERLESERLQREKAEQVAAATEAKRQKVLERSEAKRQRLQEQLEADIRIDQVRAQVAEQEQYETEPPVVVFTKPIAPQSPQFLKSKAAAPFVLALILSFLVWSSMRHDRSTEPTIAPKEADQALTIPDDSLLAPLDPQLPLRSVTSPNEDRVEVRGRNTFGFRYKMDFDNYFNKMITSGADEGNSFARELVSAGRATSIDSGETVFTSSGSSKSGPIQVHRDGDEELWWIASR